MDIKLYYLEYSTFFWPNTGVMKCIRNLNFKFFLDYEFLSRFFLWKSRHFKWINKYVFTQNLFREAFKKIRKISTHFIFVKASLNDFYFFGFKNRMNETVWNLGIKCLSNWKWVGFPFESDLQYVKELLFFRINFTWTRRK